MKIAYIARHTSGGNDDEGAVVHALRGLGHEVNCIEESSAATANVTTADFLLFNKWRDVGTLKRLSKHTPFVFWYWDLVDHPDETLARRCADRIAWMRDTIPHCCLGFLSDGDWVDRDTTGKLVWLTQGIDERQATTTASRGEEIDILFTGIGRGGGTQRESFVKEMANRYGSRFVHVERGCHGEELRNLIARTKIVVAPDSPVTDRYCSNRVYNMLGMGAFLLHPWCESLWRQYGAGEGGLTFYRDRAELHQLIASYLENAERRHTIADVSLAWTLRHHCYRHRVAELIRVVRERVGI